MSDTQIRTGGMADPVTAADGFAEEIAARAAEIEANRFLPQDIARRFAEAGLYRLCVPAAYGGREAHPAVLFETVERLARADGSAAWCVFIGATSGLVAGFLAPEEAQAVFGDPLTITAGVLRRAARRCMRSRTAFRDTASTDAGNGGRARAMRGIFPAAA